MKRHYVKIDKKYFEQQLSGIKNFELRRMDRNYKVGDELCLQEIETGREHLLLIVSILTGYKGVEEGYGILGTEKAD